MEAPLEEVDTNIENGNGAPKSLPLQYLPASLSGVAKTLKKKRRGKKTLVSRGETALPKNRGSGFEGSSVPPDVPGGVS